MILPDLIDYDDAQACLGMSAPTPVVKGTVEEMFAEGFSPENPRKRAFLPQCL